jgi:predicted DNA-binding transcriptional regulator YafY
MGKVNYKNQYALLVYLVLRDYSDAGHLIEQPEILAHLSTDYGVETQRRSISRALDVLEALDFDLIRNRKGVALGGRVFDEGQLEYVLDAVYSSPSIPQKEADKIFQTLTKSLSCEERKRLAGVEKEEERGKLANPHIFYEIGTIAGAIERKSIIQFTYNTYNEKGQLVPLEGNPRLVLPVKTYFRDGHYCLLGGMTQKPFLFRLYIDRMSDVKEIPQEKNQTVVYSETMVKSFLDKHPHLGGGEVVKAELGITDARVFNSLFVFFGDVESSKLLPDGTYHVVVKADEESILSWCFALAGNGVTLLAPQSSQEKLRKRALDLLGDPSLADPSQKSLPLSQFDLQAAKSSFFFDPNSFVSPKLSLENVKGISVRALLEEGTLSLEHLTTLFTLTSSEVQDFTDNLLSRGALSHPHPLGRLFLLETLENEQKPAHSDLLLAWKPFPCYVVNGEEKVLLCLLLILRLAYLGWKKVGNSNPELSSFFLTQFQSYWPLNFDRLTAGTAFSMDGAAPIVFPSSKDNNPSAWESASGAVDGMVSNLTPAKLKALIEGLETMYRFDLVVFHEKA